MKGQEAIGLLFILIFFIGNCNNRPKDQDKQIVIAKINNSPIYEKEFLDYYGDRDIVTYSPEVKRKLLVNLIIDRVISEELKNITLSDTETKVIFEQLGNINNDETKKILNNIYMLHHFLKQKASMNFDISSEEIKNYYGENTNKFYKKEAVLVAQLLFKNKENSIKIYKELQSKKNKFIEYSKIYNNPPYSSNGGNLGWIEHGDLPEELEAIVFHIRVGRISKPKKTTYGYQIFWVTKKRKAKYIPLIDAKEAIKRAILQNRINAEYEVLIKNVFRLNNIFINERYLYR
ncbi:peptidyl-prolyl cis-trans isomerase [bacterium]|nr:peptidyl-prolyl cis-trans isomerase [bacterium]